MRILKWSRQKQEKRPYRKFTNLMFFEAENGRNFCTVIFQSISGFMEFYQGKSAVNLTI